MPLIISSADKQGVVQHVFTDSLFNFELEILISSLKLSAHPFIVFFIQSQTHRYKLVNPFTGDTLLSPNHKLKY